MKRLSSWTIVSLTCLAHRILGSELEASCVHFHGCRGRNEKGEQLDALIREMGLIRTTSFLGEAGLCSLSEALLPLLGSAHHLELSPLEVRG